ncbi:hypothetical protein AAIH24_31255, partial [Pseudomonas aeruginosa]
KLWARINMLGLYNDCYYLQSDDRVHGGAAISLVMAVRASYMEGGEIAFTALPRHSRGFDNVQDHNNDIELPEPSAW